MHIDSLSLSSGGENPVRIRATSICLNHFNKMWKLATASDMIFPFYVLCSYIRALFSVHFAHELLCERFPFVIEFAE